MIALRRGRGLLNVLQQKQQRLFQKEQTEQRALEAIQMTKRQCLDKLSAIDIKLMECQISGILNRNQLFKTLRRQSILFGEKHYLQIELEQLEEQTLFQKFIVEECKKNILELGKKTFKVNRFIDRTRKAQLLRQEILTENDIQELSVNAKQIDL